MKVSSLWLRNFLPQLEKTAEEIGEKLTLHTAELEEIIEVGPTFDQVVFGKVLEVRPHQNSEKSAVATFDVGEGTKQVVFGKIHEVYEGDILPVALPGAKLGSGIKIEVSDRGGEKSEGMIADNADLGLNTLGLIRESDESLIGKPLSEVYESCRDQLFDIDNKSLTHRPDLMGTRGFAREVSAIFDSPLMLPEPAVSLPDKGAEVTVKIESAVCRRFCALRMEGLTVTASPIEDIMRLENLGGKGISNLVDITNLIMFEFGQPMHVFDADKVDGAIVVRQAQPGETVVALDGETYELSADDLVIADEQKVLSIDGIMGGLDSGVTETTTHIIFECANFDPTAIRKSAQRLGIRTESSMRFEKSLDPAQCKKVILSAAEKARTLCPEAIITSPLTDQFPTKPEGLKIQFNPDLVRQRSGIDIANNEIQKILESLDFKISPKGDIWKVEVPTFRATKDVSIPEDLVEEVVRMYGFGNIQSTMPVLPAQAPKRNFLREQEWTIKDFCASRGFLEVYNYNFVNAQDAEFTGHQNYVSVANPLSSEHGFLRTTLVSNFVKNLESELRTHKSIRLFEFGKVAHRIDGQVLPHEPLKAALFAAELGGTENDLFYAVKSEIQNLLAHLNIHGTIDFTACEEGEQESYFHPTKSANIQINGDNIGQVFVIHPKFSVLKNAPMVAAEIDVQALVSHLEHQAPEYEKLVAFPSVYRDLSIVLGDRVFVADIAKTAHQSTPLLRNIELFDEYQDAEKLGANLKNLAFHLEFRSREKTLEEQDIETAFSAVLESLKKEFGAQLRIDFDAQKSN